MRFIFFLLSLICCESISFSQNVITKKNAPKSSLKLYEQGVNYYKADQFEKAISSFEKAISKSPGFIDAELQWASVCFDIKKYDCAEKHFQTVLNLDSNYNSKVYYTLALTQYQLDHFHSAFENLKIFQTRELKNNDLIIKSRQLRKTLRFADSAVLHPSTISPRFIKSLNTELIEYLPSISADGKTCVFTRRSFRGDEDLFISHYIDSAWTEAQPIEELNTQGNEGSPALSPDGKSMIITMCHRNDSYGGCDLYYTELHDNTWTEPINMGDHVNTASKDRQACFAENGNAIYFSSDRKGTYGGDDIWYSRRKKDRSWTIPKNLGPVINTPGNEVCPFIHPNGSVLYFSSDFFPGMGGQDIFYSIADVRGNWQTPINMGIPINSKGDDSSLIVFPDGEKAMMASDQLNYYKKDISSRYNMDLYEFNLPSHLKINPSTYVEITVSDSLSNKAVNASVSVFDLSNNKNFYSGEINHSGKLLIALPTGADYGLHIYNREYVFVPDQFRCSDRREKYNPLIIHKRLVRISNNIQIPVILKNIFFESGSATLTTESEFELNALQSFLNDHNGIRLKITGHTDNTGAEQDNLILSQRRATAVVKYLNDKGIDSKRLISEGLGESRPIDDNKTAEGRRNNRRIEFTILSDN